MLLPYYPWVTFEMGRLHALVGSADCLGALLSDPPVARFPVACICPQTSVLVGQLNPAVHRCRTVRVRSLRELLRALSCARETLVVVEHAPVLYGEDGAALRHLSHLLRERAAFAMVVLYAPAFDPALVRLADRADRLFTFIGGETTVPAARRTLQPGQLTLTGL